RRARGGPALAGRRSLVGEEGPEVLQMGGRSGKVIPNDRLGGGVRNIFHVYDKSGNPVRTAREVARLAAFAGGV
ncbi:MAG: hypothetical protein ACRDXB_06285, partial [Actinomycetes bacterium]